MRTLPPLLAGACLWLAGCATPQTASEPAPAAGPAAAPEQAPAVTSAPDPLLERVHVAGELQPLGREELVRRMLAARVVYLGEKHDSARHHEIQRDLVEELVARGARPAVGFEIFHRAQTGLLMGYVSWKPAPHMRDDAADAGTWLRERLGWKDDPRRERTWAMYGPLLESARAHGLVAFGIDLPLGLRGRISKVGAAGLSHAERDLLAATGFDDPGYRSLMLAKLKAAHCGYGSEDYLGRLYDNWVARNDAMARAVVAALDDTEGGPVVVIVGAGHLEYDMGVVERVATLAPGIDQLALALRELPAEPRPLADHFAQVAHEGRDFGPPHGLVWFTPPPGELVDYCRDFRESVPAAAGDDEYGEG